MKALYEVAAPAKLNLFLHVVGRRDDGYHLLQSAFALIDWCDTLHFERRDDGALARHDLALPLPADDLCLRAARALQGASGSALGVDISIEKRIPSGAGLGGGSSDAASTLLALNRLWQLDWPRARLADLALRLGADVPFFIAGTNALVQGIGERIEPIELAAQTYAVLKPPLSLETRAVYSHRALVRDTPAVILSGSLADAAYGRNDLQPIAEMLEPEVARAARWLEERYGNSRMTGSGSAVFARVGTGREPVATQPAADLPPGWAFRLCRGLKHHPLADWAKG
jgi:4-diphosphocytidyl-2-C-methyl-D-erythritol kinase